MLRNYHYVLERVHYVKSVRIRSFSSPYFPAFRLHTERYEVSVRSQSECGQIRTRKTPNTDTFQAVVIIQFFLQFDFFSVDASVAYLEPSRTSTKALFCKND